MAKFQIKSRAWNVFVVAGSIVITAAGFLGLLFLQSSEASAGTVSWFVIGLGVLTFAFFAGPGLVYVARKRIPFLKRVLPGGTMTWIRSHLYLPILALVAAWVHASTVPFRGILTSGKALLGVGILVSIAGVARHHLIGVQKSAVNARAKIASLAAAHPRAFRVLVGDFTEDRRPVADLERAVAAMSTEEQETWRQIVAIEEQVEETFPRGGGQRPFVRLLKVFRAAHAPLTVLLFLVLALHVIDVLGTARTVTGDETTAFAAAGSCGSCHGDIHDQWATSSMSHAQTSTIMKAQLPVTIGRNALLAEARGAEQQALFEAAGPTCVACHAPLAANFVDDPHALLPLDASPPGRERAIDGGNAAVLADGVGCIVCHTQSQPLSEGAGFAFDGPIAVDAGGAADFGTMFGPTLDDPHPLPVRVHDISGGGVWDVPVGISLTCGGCHNVKVDLDGNGLAPGFTEGDFGDDDGDFQLNENEIDVVQDLVLQTTFDEWQDYVAGFGDRIAGRDLTGTAGPLGCIECHMPVDDTAAIVDFAPGFLTVPDRIVRSHTFVGVDYDLDPDAYREKGIGTDYAELLKEEILPLRQALLATAVVLTVDDPGATDGDEYAAEVVVENNVLGHTFPTGFAFARQFWLEVTAVGENGEPVCLIGFLGDGPCGSGEVAGRAAPVPQCDPGAVADALGLERGAVPNGDIHFADALPLGECDPWLVNFQKILTDGDPNGSGTFREVAYQSFLPDIVKVRERTIDVAAPVRPDLFPETPTRFDALDAVRLGPDGEDRSSARFIYVFDTSSLPPGTGVTVTATLRFRHLPPEFIRALEAELAGLPDDLAAPDAALIDAEELIENLVVTDVVSAASGQGGVLGCEGPQNRPDASLFDCVTPQDGEAAVGETRDSGDAGAGGLTSLTVLVLAGAALSLVRRPEEDRFSPRRSP